MTLVFAIAMSGFVIGDWSRVAAARRRLTSAVGCVLLVVVGVNPAAGAHGQSWSSAAGSGRRQRAAR